MYDLNIVRIKNRKQKANNILRRNTSESIMEDNLERGKYFRVKKAVSCLFFKFPKTILNTTVVVFIIMTGKTVPFWAIAFLTKISSLP
jgi:hypothetical protein